jgi:chromosome segregation ATPase
MEHGIRREAARLGDPTALLARYTPGPGRTARVVLHPRLTFIPCTPGDAAGLRDTLELGAPARILTADAVAVAAAHGAARSERALVFDDTVAGIEAARRERDAARSAVADAERALAATAAHLDRVVQQRAEAEAAIAAALDRIAVLERADVDEAELRRQLNDARADVGACEATLAAARGALGVPGGPGELELHAAETAWTRAEAELAAIEAEGRRTRPDYELEAASFQLRLWAAQRAAAVAREDVERLARRAQEAQREREARRAAGATGEDRAVQQAEQRLVVARARVDQIERALAQRAERAEPGDPAAEIAALRAQVDSVRTVVDAAEAHRRGERDAAERAVERARVGALDAERRLRVLLERIEPNARDVDAVLQRLRQRAAATVAGELHIAYDSEELRALHQVVGGIHDEVVVLVEPLTAAPPELTGVLVHLSEGRRIVYVTAEAGVLDAAKALDPEIAAVRTPLDVGDPTRQALARTDGNLS